MDAWIDGWMQADGHGVGVPDGPAGWLKRAASIRNVGITVN